MPSPAEMAKPQPRTLFTSELEVQPKPTAQTARRPNKSECATHLQLLNAIVRLKIAVDDWGKKKGEPEGQAWKQFCEIAAAKFSKWSEDVDTSEHTIPIPSLDVLMVWHSYMLNPREYMHYANIPLKGRLGEKR